MKPHRRNSFSRERRATLLFAILIFWSGGCASSNGSQKEEGGHSHFAFHRDGQSRIDGARCPLYPTCAWWGELALDEGIPGFLLLIDRLFYRERGGYEHHHMPVPARMSGDLRYYDPPSDTFPVLEAKRPSLFREDFSQ